MESELKELYVQESLKNKGLENDIEALNERAKSYLDLLSEINEKSRAAILADNRLVSINTLRDILHITNDTIRKEEGNEGK